MILMVTVFLLFNYISMKAASEKTSPVLAAMHHAGKNAQGYPDGARHKPALSVPYVAPCHLLSPPLIAAWTELFFIHGQQKYCCRSCLRAA